MYFFGLAILKHKSATKTERFVNAMIQTGGIWKRRLFVLVSVDRKNFDNEAFRKWWRYDRHDISLPEV